MRVGTNPVTYLHSDHLGSASATSGASVSSQNYNAFGNIRNTTGSVPTDFGFTGQRRDASAGLMYYGARYYDATLGRFVSADTIVPSAGNPQSLNRYAYVLNNPLRYKDPSGHCTGDINNPDDPDAQCWELYRSATSMLGFWATPDDLGAWDSEGLGDLVRWLDAGVRFTSDVAPYNGWTFANLHDVLDALGLVNNRIGDSTRAALGIGNNGTLTFIKSANIIRDCGTGHDGCTVGHDQVRLKLTANGSRDQRNLVIHELGHVVDWHAGNGQFRSANSESWLTAGGWRWVRDEGWETYGFRGAARVYGLQNPLEDFAETFTWSVLNQNGESYFDNGLNLLGAPNPGRQQELNVMLGEFQ